MSHRSARCAALALTLLLGGCAAHAPLERPALALPDQWRAGTAQAGAEPPHDDAAPAGHPPRAGAPAAGQDIGTEDWWRGFGSEALAQAVRRALEHNPDLAAARARVAQARALADMSAAARWPEITAELGSARQGRLDGHGQDAGGSHRLGVAARYEADLWGGRRAAWASSMAHVQASELEAQTRTITVSAETAGAWLRLAALIERRRIAEANLRDAERLLALMRARAEAGAETALAVAQQRTLLAVQRRAAAALRQQAHQAQAQLLSWTGLSALPEIPAGTLATLGLPGVDAGVPSLLMTRRPDIAAAEARLRAADADVQAARAAMLPSLSLSVGAGGEAAQLRRLLDHPLYTLAAGLTAPIFNAGRLAAGHRLALAQREALLADYRRAIVDAFTDAQSALDGLAGAQAQASARAEELAQARLALDLAESRYRAGAETQLTLLDTQRALYAAQDGATQARADLLLATVDLYRALGGGWRAGPE